VFYDLHAAREERKAGRAAIVRVEQLHPFPDERLSSVLAGCSSAREFVWVQEEARNMGAWTFIQPRLAALLPAGASLRYAGRAASASPATGSAAVHKRELAELLAAALSA
ncbi:MAG: 2-oxoglutarate dehydrogenase E1 component, partial [Thermoanaerobaculia bacterium]